MYPETFTPPLIATGIVFIMLFMVFAFLSERYAEEDIQTGVKPKEVFKPYDASHLQTHDYCEWWTPIELDICANEIAVKNENMAALVGHHSEKQFDNVIFPIVRQWYQNDKGEDAHGHS